MNHLKIAWNTISEIYKAPEWKVLVNMENSFLLSLTIGQLIDKFVFLRSMSIAFSEFIVDLSVQLKDNYMVFYYFI